MKQAVKKVISIIAAIVLPPVAVFIHNGAGKDLIINILLWMLFFIPAMIHALWLVLR